MDDRFAEARKALEHAVLDGPGHTTASMRQRLARGGDVPEALRALVDKIKTAAYKVTDEDVAALAAHYSEDEIFEIVIATTLGASLECLHAGLATIEEP